MAANPFHIYHALLLKATGCSKMLLSAFFTKAAVCLQILDLSTIEALVQIILANIFCVFNFTIFF
jgi:hypothetical protein